VLQYMITSCILSETCSWDEFSEVEFGPLSYQKRCNQQLPGTVVEACLQSGAQLGVLGELFYLPIK
jgi:hypothetical protein